MTGNKYTVKDSFTFAEEIVEQISEFFMGNLDFDSLFTNIPLEETINICTNALFENTEKVEVYQKYNLGNFYLLLQKSLILFLTESSSSKSMESL